MLTSDQASAMFARQSQQFAQLQQQLQAAAPMGLPGVAGGAEPFGVSATGLMGAGQSAIGMGTLGLGIAGAMIGGPAAALDPFSGAWGVAKHGMRGMMDSTALSAYGDAGGGLRGIRAARSSMAGRGLSTRAMTMRGASSFAAGLAPYMALGAAVDFAGGQMMQGAQQADAMSGMLAQGQRAGMTNLPGGSFGSGVSTSTTTNITSGVRNILGDMNQSAVGQHGVLFGGQHLTSMGQGMNLLGAGMEMGAFKDASTSQQFLTKFRELLSTTKTVADALGQTREEAMQFMSQYTGMGFSNLDTAAGAVMQARGMGAAGGLSTQLMTTIGAGGAYVSRMMGGKGIHGVKPAQELASMLGAGMRAGRISDSDIADVAGVGGQQGIASLSMKWAAQARRSLGGTKMGQDVVAALVDPETGKLDYGALQQFSSGGMTLDDITGAAKEHRKSSRFRELMQARGAGFLSQITSATNPATLLNQMATLQMGREGELTGMPESREAILQQITGAGENEANMIQSLGSRIRGEHSNIVGKWEQALQAGMSQKYSNIDASWQGIKSALYEKYVGPVERKLQGLGTDVRGMLSNWLSEKSKSLGGMQSYEISPIVDTAIQAGMSGGTEAMAGVLGFDPSGGGTSFGARGIGEQGDPSGGARLMGGYMADRMRQHGSMDPYGDTSGLARAGVIGGSGVIGRVGGGALQTIGGIAGFDLGGGVSLGRRALSGGLKRLGGLGRFGGTAAILYEGGRAIADPAGTLASYLPQYSGEAQGAYGMSIDASSGMWAALSGDMRTKRTLDRGRDPFSGEYAPGYVMMPGAFKGGDNANEKGFWSDVGDWIMEATTADHTSSWGGTTAYAAQEMHEMAAAVRSGITDPMGVLGDSNLKQIAQSSSGLAAYARAKGSLTGYAGQLAGAKGLRKYASEKSERALGGEEGILSVKYAMALATAAGVGPGGEGMANLYGGLPGRGSMDTAEGKRQRYADVAGYIVKGAGDPRTAKDAALKKASRGMGALTEEQYNSYKISYSGNKGHKFYVDQDRREKWQATLVDEAASALEGLYGGASEDITDYVQSMMSGETDKGLRAQLGRVMYRPQDPEALSSLATSLGVRAAGDPNSGSAQFSAAMLENMRDPEKWARTVNELRGTARETTNPELQKAKEKYAEKAAQQRAMSGAGSTTDYLLERSVGPAGRSAYEAYVNAAEGGEFGKMGDAKSDYLQAIGNREVSSRERGIMATLAQTSPLGSIHAAGLDYLRSRDVLEGATGKKKSRTAAAIMRQKMSQTVGMAGFDEEFGDRLGELGIADAGAISSYMLQAIKETTGGVETKEALRAAGLMTDMTIGREVSAPDRIFLAEYDAAKIIPKVKGKYTEDNQTLTQFTKQMGVLLEKVQAIQAEAAGREKPTGLAESWRNFWSPSSKK
jgi:hypothetical protein